MTNRIRIGYAFAGGVIGASAIGGDPAGIGAGIVAIAVVAVAEYALVRRGADVPQFADLEHAVIPSDDAYDYADALPEGQTVIEDKRTGECYVAERSGGEA